MKLTTSTEPIVRLPSGRARPIPRGTRTLPSLIIALVFGLCACRTPAWRRELLNPEGRGPRILCVVAHPDDEIAFAGTLYKAASHLDGRCDVATLTNGEGGFKYATLAERLYGLELTDETVGRRELPAIRARELMASCRLLGVHAIYFFGQTDHRYTQDVLEVLGPDAEVWRLAEVRPALSELLQRNRYDFVLTLAPTAETHGHHKAATILALEAAAACDPALRPVVLCVQGGSNGEDPPAPQPLAGFPETRLRTEPSFVFDRKQRFGYRERLDYSIVANWAIAEHKSQGTMQLLAGRGEREVYRLFDQNAPGAEAAARALFEALAEPQFSARSYGASAGTNTDQPRADQPRAGRPRR